jgi:hypothetical protein
MLQWKAVTIAKDYAAKRVIGLFVSGYMPTSNNEISM